MWLQQGLLWLAGLAAPCSTSSAANQPRACAAWRCCSYLHHVLPRLDQLTDTERDEAMLQALQQLPTLASQERGLLQAMEQVRLRACAPQHSRRLHRLHPQLQAACSPADDDALLLPPPSQARFVPNMAGALHMPRELYDPRNQDLLRLLDPSQHFPSAAFCGAESALPMLQRCDA